MWRRCWSHSQRRVDEPDGARAGRLGSDASFHEIEALKESMRPPMRWVEVIVEPGQEAPPAPEGCHVIENHILLPEPVVEELPPEYVAVADATATQRELEAEEFARNTKPRKRILPPDERPFSLNYPKQSF